MEEYVKKTPHLKHEKAERVRKVVIKQPEAPRSALKFFIDKKLEGVEPEDLEATKLKYKNKFDNLPEHKVIKYIKKAVADKERYEKELNEFKEANPDFVIKPTKTNLNEKQREIYEHLVLKRPKKPHGSAYIQYCEENLTSLFNKGESNPTRQMQLAAEEWKKVSPNKIAEINRRLNDSIEAYIPEMEAWLATQPEEVRQRIQKDEPRAMPDYWKKLLNRRRKTILKEIKKVEISSESSD